MLSNSKKKLNDAVKNMTAEEALRATIKAFHQQNSDAVNAIKRSLPDNQKEEVDKLFNLYMKKLFFCNWLIINKAMLAISYYQGLIFPIFNLGSVDDPPNFELLYEAVEKTEKEIKNLELEAKGALNLEEFQDLSSIGEFCDQWIILSIKILTGYSISDPNQDFDMIKSRLEQMGKERYTEK